MYNRSIKKYYGVLLNTRMYSQVPYRLDYIQKLDFMQDLGSTVYSSIQYKSILSMLLE